MKETIFNYTASAGRTIILTGLTESLSKDNILGIINKTQAKVLYSPMLLTNVSSVTYNTGTLTIVFAESVPAMVASDKILIKVYTDGDNSSSGSGSTTNRLEQFFGISSSYEAEAVGQETTNNPVIDECKTRYAEVFGDLLPSDFVMPNSVTIDGTTYTGTVS